VPVEAKTVGLKLVPSSENDNVPLSMRLELKIDTANELTVTALSKVNLKLEIPSAVPRP
jgi:hypothetical protein